MFQTRLALLVVLLAVFMSLSPASDSSAQRLQAHCGSDLDGGGCGGGSPGPSEGPTETERVIKSISKAVVKAAMTGNPAMAVLKTVIMPVEIGGGDLYTPDNPAPAPEQLFTPHASFIDDPFPELPIAPEQPFTPHDMPDGGGGSDEHGAFLK